MSEKLQEVTIKALQNKLVEDEDNIVFDKYNITISSSGRSMNFKNYDDFCKELKRYFSPSQINVYNKLRTFDKSKLKNGYVQNDWWDMSTFAYVFDK